MNASASRQFLRLTCLTMADQWLCLAVTMLIIVAGSAPLLAQDEELEQAKAAVQLSDTPWEDRAFGLMVRPPASAKEKPGGAEEALVHFADGKRFTMSVSIRKTENALELPEIVRQANNDIGFQHPSFVPLRLGRESVRVGKRPAARMYFHIPANETTRKPWVMGQTFVKIDPFTVAIIRIEFDMERLNEVRPIYEKVLDGITFKDPELIEKERVALVERGSIWSGLQTYEAMLNAIYKEDQWFRILDDRGRDIGHIHITEEEGEKNNAKGIIIRVESRVMQDENPVDTVRNMFLSKSGIVEYWDYRTTVRPDARKVVQPRNGQNPPAIGPVEQSWAESGLRGDQELPAFISPNQKMVNAITVSRESPAGVNELQWETPDKGYLSQVHLQLLGRILPRKGKEEYAFYAYKDGEIVLRTEKVIPNRDGSYTVISMPNIKRPLTEVRNYDREGKLLQATLPSGRMIKPATLQQIKAIWHLR